MNKIEITTIDNKVKVSLDFECVEAAREFFNNKECIEDILGALPSDEDEEEELDDNNMLRAEVITQVAKTSTKTLHEIFFTIRDELKKREACSMK